MKLFKTLATLSFFVSAWLTLLGAYDLFWASMLFLALVAAAALFTFAPAAKMPIVMTSPEGLREAIDRRLDKESES